MNELQNDNQKQNYADCNSYTVARCHSLSRVIPWHLYPFEIKLEESILGLIVIIQFGNCFHPIFFEMKMHKTVISPLVS
jgi:hypothetical protein